MIEIAAGITVNLYLLIGLATGVGMIAGFVGVSGGYLLTPILMIMGFPADLAVGTALALMTGNTLVAIIRHRELGNLDLKMGLITAAGTMAGAEVGVRLLAALKSLGTGLAEIIVMSTLLLALILVGVSMIREVIESSANLANGCEIDSAAEEGEVRTAACRFLQGLSIFPHIRFTKSKLRISGWIVLGLGAIIGVLSGFLGVGGGFMRCPALIYLIGQSSMMAVGTNLIGSFVGLTFGCFRHAMLNNVMLGVALAMMMGMSLGTFIGAKGTSYLKGLAVRYVLAGSVIAALFGPGCKLVYFLTDVAAWDKAARILTVAQIAVPVASIIVLLVLAIRHVNGHDVPDWARRLMARSPHAAAG